MLWKKIMMISMIALVLSSCSDGVKGSDTETADGNKEYSLIEHNGNNTTLAEIYHNIYDEAKKTNAQGSLDMLRCIIAGLGENGYSAVDGENQIDMTQPEQIKEFCEQVKMQQEAEETLIVVMSASSFVKYEFTTKDGDVEVWRSYYLYKGDYLETASTKHYPAYTWEYSEGGYLFFEEYHMPGFDGPSGHTAVRIEPLDEKCRELNRTYLWTIGYELNNLFTSDWSESDFQQLQFYDLYEVMYQMKNEHCPALFLNQGVNYEIPKLEFESVFQNFFQIDGEILQQYTTYHEDTETYQYRARGMYDFAPTPYIPYPEVISYEENKDGTIKLIVNAVWPEKNMEKAFGHEVVIRPLDKGKFQYVSNYVIPSENNAEATWYTERLTVDKWQEYYRRNVGGSGDSD